MELYLLHKKEEVGTQSRAAKPAKQMPAAASTAGAVNMNTVVMDATRAAAIPLIGGGPPRSPQSVAPQHLHGTAMMTPGVAHGAVMGLHGQAMPHQAMPASMMHGQMPSMLGRSGGLWHDATMPLLQYPQLQLLMFLTATTLPIEPLTVALPPKRRRIP